MNKLLFGLYIFLSISLTSFSYIFVDPNLSYLQKLYSGFASQYRLQTTILYVLIIFLFFIFYFLFLWLLSKKRLNVKYIRLLIFTTVGILFFSYPAMLSYDIFNYIATGKVLFFYHENPYIIMPIEFTEDPLLSFTHAANKIALYGPSWILLTAIPYTAGLGSFLLTLFSFKLFIVLFYFALVFLIWKMSKNMISVILFAFNPLVVIETLISGHNDVVMIFFAVLSLFFLMKKKIFFAIFLFIFSILIKYATIFLIPIFLYALWKIIKSEEVNWKSIFYFSSVLMFIGFLLSPIREEIYPWYAIWFLTFAFLNPHKKFLVNISLFFSFGLLLRYTPYIFTGTYGGQTPVLKEIISFILPVLYSIYYVLKKKI